MEKKKVVAVITNDHAWTYNLRYEILQSLLDQGYRVVLILGYGNRIEDLVAMGCEFIDVPFDKRGLNPIKDLKLLLRYWKELKKLKPDIVLTYTIKPNIYGNFVCRFLKIPCIANITGLGTAVEYGGILQKITVMLYKIAFKKIHTIFFQNKENRQFFLNRKIANPESFALLPGSGVNLQKFSPLEYPSEEKTEFVFISRIMKDKGIDQYLDAAKAMKEKYPQTVFHICGSCDRIYEDVIKELHDHGTIVYHGMIPDVKEVLKRTHCTVHPTYYPEGLSNVLLESSACARPIITTNRSGCREVIDDGVNGFIVNQRDSQDLIDKIEKFINLSHEEKKEMGLAGRRKVEKEFDRQIVVERYSEKIKRCLESGL